MAPATEMSDGRPHEGVVPQELKNISCGADELDITDFHWALLIGADFRYSQNHNSIAI